jgi:hypothetical protein
MDPAQYAAYQQQQQQQGAAAAGNNGQQRQQAAYYGQDVDEDEFLGDDDVDLIPADYSQQPAEGYIDDAHSGECARTSRQAERATQAGQAADWLAAPRHAPGQRRSWGSTSPMLSPEDSQTHVPSPQLRCSRRSTPRPPRRRPLRWRRCPTPCASTLCSSTRPCRTTRSPRSRAPTRATGTA